MLFKGTVEQVIDDFTVRVRIPYIHKVNSSTTYTMTEDLPVAYISTLPNTKPNIRLGDVVVVGFENNDLSRPMILGHLATDIPSQTTYSSVLNSLEVQYDAKFSEDTSIGDVTPENIRCLLGVKENLQQQINQLRNEISLIQEDISVIQKDILELKEQHE